MVRFDPHTLQHGTGVALGIDRDGPLIGVLLIGPSGAGKSDLAIRLIESCPWRRSRLICDDAVGLKPQGDHLIMQKAELISDLIEVRQFGMVFLRALPALRLDLCVTLTQTISRMPEIETISSLENDRIPVPMIRFDARPASAAPKLRMIARKIMTGSPLCDATDKRHSDPERDNL